MSYNRNYYQHNIHGNPTFQNPMYLPPPPAPPPFFIQPMQKWPLPKLDDEFIKQFENNLPKVKKNNPEPVMSITNIRDKLKNMILTLNTIKEQEKMLIENLDNYSDEGWNEKIKEVESNKAVVTKLFGEINILNIEVLRRLLVKRSAKRARQKRQRVEKKKVKEEWTNRNKENSRKIDEHLQKIQDDINKAMQEEEAKFQADAVLRETVRKKQDSKKYLVKLDALLRLRKARVNTVKGRGENVSEREVEVFENHIEQLKSLWTKRLLIYEKEEAEFKAKLSQDVNVLSNTNEKEKQVTENIGRWKQVLFGGELPQVDLAGDVGRFVALRSQWDRYLSVDGTAIPIGWVPPVHLAE